MVYTVNGNIAIINGQNSIYDKKINSAEVKYGRNAVDNYKSYTKDLSSGSKLPPVQFAYSYIPKGNYSMQALMGNAYEELGKKTKIQLSELNKQIESSNQQIKQLGGSSVHPNTSADALDLNNDGFVDISEYATSIMAADMLDGNPTQCQIRNLDGTITNVGENASLGLYDKSNIQNAKMLFSQIHQHFNLNQAMQEFIKNPNNMG